MHDNDLPQNPLRAKVFVDGPFDEDRLEALVEFLAQLDDRVKVVEQGMTDLIVPPAPPANL